VREVLLANGAGHSWCCSVLQGVAGCCSVFYSVL